MCGETKLSLRCAGRSACPVVLRHAFAMLIALLALAVLGVGTARAETVTSASVLIVDSNTGDAELCGLHWLGEANEVVAEEGSRSLRGSEKPVWWQGDGAPATFLLAADGIPITSSDVAWALDRIRESGAEPRTFVIAMGTAGLPVREYVQDQGKVPQSERADVVGLAFLGTPHNGYTVSTFYPEASLWSSLGPSVGLTVADLASGSAYVQALNAATFPRVLKTLVVVGSVGDLGFGATDGAGIQEDLSLSSSVSSQIELQTTEATIGRAINLTGAWQPFTSSIDYPDRTVDAKLVERLSAMECYETSEDAQAKVRSFYQMWFDQKTIVTHASYAVLMDLSGSMLEKIDASTSKLDAAKQAAKEYLHAIDTCEALPLSAPMDVAVIGFSEATSTLASGHDSAAIATIDGAHAAGETDIGLALDAALAVLDEAPTCATRHILLLSDGASTQGQTNEQMLANAGARAKELGIAIDTIGFGDVGESNAAFLKELSDETGGETYSVADTYALRVDFLKSYYASLGSDLVDAELEQGQEEQKTIAADANTLALQLGLVAQADVPQNVTLLCNGQPVDESLYTTSVQNGFVSIQCLSPADGNYSVRVPDRQGALHLFAVRQQGIAARQVAAQVEDDPTLIIVLVVGVVLVAGVILVAVLGRRRSGDGPRSGELGS